MLSYLSQGSLKLYIIVMVCLFQGSFHVYSQGIISFHMVTQLLESTDVGFHSGVCLLSTFFTSIR